MVWACPRLRAYWEGVAEVLGDMGGTRVPVDPMVLLLSYLGEVEGDRYVKLCITFFM